LRPGGRLYATVPTYSWLWSHEDFYAGHFRRYYQAGLRQLLESEGFQVEYLSYFFSFLVLPILAGRVLPFRLGVKTAGPKGIERPEHQTQGWRSRILDLFLEWERERIGERRIPFGSSCLVVAQAG
jgi:hypothetical protein